MLATLCIASCSAHASGSTGDGCTGTGTVRTVSPSPSPSRGDTSTPTSSGVDVPTIPQPDGSLLIDAPGSRMDRAVVRTQQDADDLWRILYGAPYPSGLGVSTSGSNRRTTP
jgi:hypothetical protein